MSIRKIKAGRVHFPAENYVGELGTIFYDETTGNFRLSNGEDPGGTIIMPDLVNGFGDIKVFNANVVGNLSVQGTTTSVNNTVVENVQTITGTLTVTGVSTINGEMDVFGPSHFIGDTTFIGNTMFTGSITEVGNLQVTGNTVSTGHSVFIVSNPSDSKGSVEITGNSDGSFQTPYNTGVMLHVTGQTGSPSRVYIDAQNNYAVLAGRRYNGTTLSPTGLLANDLIFRVAATPYTANGWPTTTNTSSPRIDYVCSENQFLTNQGNRIEFWTTPIAGNVVTKVMTLDSTNGVTATQFNGPLNGSVTGSILTAAQPNITSVGTLTSLNVTNATTTGSLITSNVQITGGSISNVAISNSTGTFTTLSAISGISGLLLTASQPNITSVGILTSLNVTNYANVGQLVTSNIWSTGGSINNVVIGNVTPTSGSFTTLLASGGITGTIQTAAQPNITSVGTLTSLITANAQISGGAITSTPISGSTGSFTTLSGTIQTAAQPNITSVGTLTSLNVTNATTTGSLITSNVQITGGAINNTSIGNVTPAFGTFSKVIVNEADGNTDTLTLSSVVSATHGINIKMVGNGVTTPGKYLRVTNGNFQIVNNAYTVVLWSLDESGNQTAIGNISGVNNLTVTNTTTTGSLITSNIWSTGGSINNVVIGNVTPTSASFTTLTGTIQTAAQPNITSVGTLTGLTVTNYANVGLLTVSNTSTFNNQATFITSTVSPTTSAIEISANPAGTFQAPTVSGAMLQITGNVGIPTRCYNDGQGTYPVYAGRRYNGTTSSPTGVATNDIFARFGGTPYTSGGWPANVAVSSPHIDFVATETQTLTSLGNKIDFWATPLSSNVATKVVSIDTTNGLTVTGNVTSNFATANIVLPAGTSTTAPLRFTSGSLLATPVAGVMNYDGKLFYSDPQGQERGVISSDQVFILNSNLVTTPADTNQHSLFGVGVSLSSNTRYHFVISYAVTRTSGGGATLSMGFGGTATLAQVGYAGISNTQGGLQAVTQFITSNFSTGITITSTGNNTQAYSVIVDGFVDVTTGGTFIPTIAFSSLPTTQTVLPFSNMRISPIGTPASNTSIGTWA